MISSSPARCPGCGGSFDGPENLCCYCHAGVRFADVGLAATPTELPCPRCGEEVSLVEGKYRGVLIDVCPRCEGSWYDLGELESLVRSARRDAVAGSFTPSRPTSSRADESRSAVYLRCPHCARIMDRRNFEKRSGILINWCLHHGVWLDGGELQRVRAWAAGYPEGPPPPQPAEQCRPTAGDSSLMEILSASGTSTRTRTSAGMSWLEWVLARLFN